MSEHSSQYTPTWLTPFENRGDLPKDSISSFEIDQRQSFAPIITTFFSLRGGVGRTTAMVHSAIELSKLGYKVVCLDTDFEAPSLDKQLGISSKSPASPGLLDTLFELEMSGEVSGSIISRLIKFGEDDLFIFPAGTIDEEYIKNIRWLDTEVWYSGAQNPFQKLIELLKDSPLAPDYIFIDSRTGFNQTSAPLIFRESDIVTIVMSPTEQSMDGNALVAKGIKNSINFRNNRIEVRYLLSPIPQNYSYASEAISYGRRKISEWWSDETYEDLNDHICHIFYDEKIVTAKTAKDVLDRSAYMPIVNWLSALIPSEIEEEAPSLTSGQIKKTILESLYEICSRNTGIAEHDEDIEKYFLENLQYKKITSERIALITGRKGTGKTTLFRHFVSKFDAIVLSAPRSLQSHFPLAPSRTTYADWAKVHGVDIGAWRKFWLLQFLKIISNTENDLHSEHGNLTESEIVKAFEILKTNTDVQPKSKVVIVADGLDDGFGSSKYDAITRDSAIAGLIDFWYQYASEYTNYSFKILIRHDLWSKTAVVNKTHLEVFREEIKWSMEDYLTILIRLSCQSRPFAEDYISKFTPGHNPENILDVIKFDSAWTVIFGDRMDTGKSSFTKNWVWKRLGDSNGEHSVRMLIYLFKSSIEKELRESRPYKSLIRPKSLIDALPDVSNHALNSLEEEYSFELNPLIEILNKIKNTPFLRKEVSEVDENMINFAKTVGLIDQRDDGRISIPDLYRYALEMTRKGKH